MEHPEEKCMEMTMNLLRLLGSWPRWNQMDKISEKLYLCYSVFLCSCMAIYVIILGYGLTKNGDWSFVNMHIEEILVFSTGLISLLKMLMLIMYQGKIQEMIDFINLSLNRRYLVTGKDRKVIFQCIKHEKILVKLYAGLAALMVILLTGSSLTRMVKESWADNYDSMLPLKYTFPVNDCFLFIICYFHQIIVLIMNGAIGTLTDAVFSCLVYYVCGHLVIIKKRFQTQHMFIDRSCLNYHKEILGSATLMIAWVQRIFENFLNFMIFINSFLLCLGLLHMTQAGSTNGYEKSFIYLSIKLSQLFLYCWYGQEIMDRSEELSFACYSTKWYQYLGDMNPINFKFILHRTQKPVQIRAGYFFTASILTLKSVMNTAYSFFTMLSSVRKREDNR